ncbi:MAG: cytochrome c-type bioproteinis protein CcmF [Methanohalophilus sp.]|jgi:cytochrome c-type biogenesis protein CcmF|nr:MAG: cytochrome c-type bioproteinis protein CcmF [Methanohalophilus sp.]
MNFGMIIIWLAFLFGLLSMIYSYLGFRRKNDNYRIISSRLEIACAVLITVASVMLMYYLYDVAAFFEYVYTHSSLDLSTYYRLSAFWAGQEGSLLLWAWAISVMLLVLRYASRFSTGNVFTVTRILSLGILSVFLMLLVLDNPFAVYYSKAGSIMVSNWNPFIHPYHLTDGQGMNPLLRNPWMAIHPPILFLGYAAFTIPFTSAIAGLLLNDSSWRKIANNWMRISWLFLTAGIGLGGFWAYEVLGWGAWYWSWDPVETSSLIPWITATAYLHTIYGRQGQFRFLAPAMAIFSFILVIFATFVTRSGMWASVHSWQDFNAESLLIGIFLAGVTLAGTSLLAKRYFEEQD